MGMAALVAGWEQGYGRWAVPSGGPLAGSGAVGGVPFCQDELGAGSYLRIKIGFGAALGNPSSSWTFTDVSTDVMQAGGNQIEISPMGRQPESIQTPSASCKLMLNNRQNLYS